jgi:hypothetical protein
VAHGSFAVAFVLVTLAEAASDAERHSCRLRPKDRRTHDRGAGRMEAGVDTVLEERLVARWQIWNVIAGIGAKAQGTIGDVSRSTM